MNTVVCVWISLIIIVFTLYCYHETVTAIKTTLGDDYIFSLAAIVVMTIIMAFNGYSLYYIWAK